MPKGIPKSGIRKKPPHFVGHGHSFKGRESKTYKSWKAMKNRCDAPAYHAHARYAALGYDQRWSSFDNFLADMGDRPDGMTLDRRDNAKGYSKDNCRWATAAEQGRNRTPGRNRKITFDQAVEMAVLALRGVPHAEIGRKFGVSHALSRQIVIGRTWVDALAAAKQTIEGVA
jgi:hypothetical protein